MKTRSSLVVMLSAVMLVSPGVGRAGTTLTLRSASNRIIIEWVAEAVAQTSESSPRWIVPSYQLESSTDLEHWEKLGATIAGGLVASREAQGLISARETRRFYRLSGRYDLAGLDLTGVNLTNADLRRADLRGVNLTAADLSGAILEEADLSGAVLISADLRSANLRRADLRGADITGANLIGANLEDAVTDAGSLDTAIRISVGSPGPPARPLPPGVSIPPPPPPSVTVPPPPPPPPPSVLFPGAVHGGAHGGAGFGSGIGYSVGGAKDINNFRENIANDFLPLFTDVTYEGLYYDYFFDPGEVAGCEETLFCPSYSQAISSDPYSGEVERYLSVGLSSGIQENAFARKQLNLVIVLDVSGSMSSSFNRYYYDRFGNTIDLEGVEEDLSKQKMQVANEAVVALLDHLSAGDAVGIVLFNGSARLMRPLTPVSDIDLGGLKDEILLVAAGGSTDMSQGLEMGRSLFNDLPGIDLDLTENRIIFLTDAQPNQGALDEDDLLDITRGNAEQHVHTTFIGIGVDFNTELIEHITKIRGANYYSVHSPDQFIKRMDEGFDYMVTPLVFNLQVVLDGEGYSIEKVYGSPEADEAAGQVMKVNTLFPSKTEDGEIRGGVILLQLAKDEEIEKASDRLTLSVSYEDRLGNQFSSEVIVDLIEGDAEFFENSGIQKAILLTRYANLLKNWINDERQSYEAEKPVVPVVSDEGGIPIPIEVELSQWERQSIPLFVSSPYRQRFAQFLEYFREQAAVLGDESLEQETVILEKLRGLTVVEAQD